VLGSVYYFNLSGLGRCIISLDRDTVADESEWLSFFKVLLQVGVLVLAGIEFIFFSVAAVFWLQHEC